jgi:hypothetical protein
LTCIRIADDGKVPMEKPLGEERRKMNMLGGGIGGQKRIGHGFFSRRGLISYRPSFLWKGCVSHVMETEE